MIYIPKSKRNLQLFVYGRETTEFKKGITTFDATKITPVKNQVHVKPLGGLWTSTFLPEGPYASGWVEWCHSDQPEWIMNGKEKPAWLLEVSPNARIYIINSVADLLALKEKYPLVVVGGQFVEKALESTSMTLLDWEKIAQDYDGVNLTESGQWATRLSKPGLYGWDSESTIWFRNIFTRIVPYTGKLVRKNSTLGG